MLELIRFLSNDIRRLGLPFECKPTRIAGWLWKADQIQICVYHLLGQSFFCFALDT